MSARVESIETMVQETIRLTELGLRQFDGVGGRLPTGQSVIVLGMTGVGKSTLINLLADVRLRALYDDDTGRMRILADSQLPDIQIGQRMVSETSIPQKWVTQDGVTYWDCPGWEDNRGVEQEIANAICIKKLFEISESVKIILVTNDANFMDTRATQLVSLIGDLDQLFLGNVDQIRSSIALIVSHAAERRTEGHVINNISRVIEDLEIEGAPRILLTSLTTQPISIFRTPSQPGPIDTTGIRAEILDKIQRVSHATGVLGNISISARCKVTLHEAYNFIVTGMNREITQFVDSFRKCVNDFAAPYSDLTQRLNENERQVATPKLERVASMLRQEGAYAVQEILPMITKCLEIGTACGASLQSDGLMQALGRIKIMEELEKHVDEGSRIPMEMVRCIREQIAASRITVEKAIINITAMNEMEKAEKEKQRADREAQRAETEKANAAAAERRAEAAEAQRAAAVQAAAQAAARHAAAQSGGGKRKKKGCTIS